MGGGAAPLAAASVPRSARHQCANPRASAEVTGSLPLARRTLRLLPLPPVAAVKILSHKKAQQSEMRRKSCANKQTLPPVAGAKQLNQPAR